MITLQLDRQTGQGSLVGLNDRIEEIVINSITQVIAEQLADNLTETLLVDEMAIQNAIGNTLRSGIRFLLGSDATGDLYYRDATGILARLGIGANGQVLVVNGGLPSWQDQSAVDWSVITTATQAAVINSGYIVNFATLSTITLPATAPVGSVLRIVGMGAGGWRLAQATGQQVHFGNVSSTSGTGGQINSTHERDCINLVCTVANTTWQVIASIGNLDVI